jgi:two-component system, OmpR family, sensor histidine kinase ChvG
MYGQFESADRSTRELVARSMKDRSWLIAQALGPVLDGATPQQYKTLNRELDKFVDRGTILRLLLQPPGGGSFYYVATAPSSEPGRVGAELESLAEQGVLPRLVESCSWDRPLDMRYRQDDGKEEILTSVVPIKLKTGCWLLISVHNATEFLDTSIGRPYWQTKEVRFAATSYLLFALLAVLMATAVTRSLHHFRKVTREMRRSGVAGRSFAGRAVVPELKSVANEFDRLVLDLRSVAQDIRQRAEDNAHSFKAPLGTILMSLEAVKRGAPKDDAKCQRAIQLIESSLDRLRMLVNSAQRLEFNTADLIDAPRVSIEFAGIVADVLLRYRQVLGERGLQLVRKLEGEVLVQAGKGVLDVVVENILDNAISFSPPGSKIVVALTAQRGEAHLRIEDEGPGIDPDDIERVFERYVSLRQREREDANLAVRDTTRWAEHAGLGLWIVRRNVEALGGRVIAANRDGRGLSVEVILPIVDQ